MAKTPKTKTATPDLKPLVIGDCELDLAAHGKHSAASLGDLLAEAFPDHVHASYLHGSTLYLRLTSEEAVRAYKRVKSWLHACAVHHVLATGQSVQVSRELREACPDCGGSIKRDYLPGHRGSLLCKEAQRVASLRAAGYVEAGQAYRSIENAGVDVQWVPRHVYFASDKDGRPTLNSADGFRVAPSWAVLVASVTVVPHDLRTLVLEHCNEHGAAREALTAALRLGPGGTKARRNKQAKTTASLSNAAKMRTLFENTLLHTGDV